MELTWSPAEQEVRAEVASGLGDLADQEVADLPRDLDELNAVKIRNNDGLTIAASV